MVLTELDAKSVQEMVESMYIACTFYTFIRGMRGMKVIRGMEVIGGMKGMR